MPSFMLHRRLRIAVALLAIWFAACTQLEPPAPAKQAAATPIHTFKRGVVVAHWLGHLQKRNVYANPQWFGPSDVEWLAAQRFDHVRILAGGEYWLDEQDRLIEERVRPFDGAVRWTRERGLGIVLTMLDLPGIFDELGEPGTARPLLSDPRTQQRIEALWRQIAQRYVTEGDNLRFEIIAYTDRTSGEALRAFNRRMLAAVRTSSPTRMVYLTAPNMQIAALHEVELPDPHTALALGFWDLDVFALQGDENRPLVEFPGKVPDLSAYFAEDPSLKRFSNEALDLDDIDVHLDKVASWAAQQPVRRDVLVEFGVYARAADASAMNYVSGVRSALERHGFGWVVYDYNSGCAVRGQDGQPTRVLQALGLQPSHAAAK